MSDGNTIRKLRRALREREARLHEVEERLEALEGSTTYQVARVVVGAGRRPAKGAVRLPRQLYRLWKRRTSGPGKGPLRDRPRFEGFDRVEDRLLVGEPYVGLAVAGVFARSTADGLEGHARLVRLYPHVTAAVLDAADVDLVLVDAAAGEPGGPWAYLGVPGMYDRERALLDVREVARSRGLPLVLWGAAPPPTLTRLDWDAVVVPGYSPADDLAALAARFAITPT